MGDGERERYDGGRRGRRLLESVKRDGNNGCGGLLFVGHVYIYVSCTSLVHFRFVHFLQQKKSYRVLREVLEF